MLKFDEQMKHQSVTSCCIASNKRIINSSSVYRKVVNYLCVWSSADFKKPPILTFLALLVFFFFGWERGEMHHAL